MQRMSHDDPWLPVKCVSRTNKDILPFTDFVCLSFKSAPEPHKGILCYAISVMRLIY